MKIHFHLAFCLIAILPAYSSRADLRSDLDRLILPQIAHGEISSVVIGISENGKRTYYSYGSAKMGSEIRVDENSLYEIGSITKTFTGIALGSLASRNVLNLNDALTVYFPSLKGTDAGKITLLELSTHTSGLPKNESNLSGPDRNCAGPRVYNPNNPQGSYSLENLLCYLSHFSFTSRPSQFDHSQYSNTGVQTLGAALTLAEHKNNYSELIESEILKPLGLTDTAVNLTSAQEKRFVTGYNGVLSPTEPFTQDPMLGGVGALRSSVRDLLTYLEANLSPPATDLGRGIRLSHQVQKTGAENWDIGLNWFIQKNASDPIYYHDGATYGSTSLALFRPQSKKAIVFLANTYFSNLQCLQDYFLGKPCAPIFDVPLTNSDFSKLIGHYENHVLSLAGDLIEKNHHLVMLRRDGTELRLRANSKTSFSFASSPQSKIVFNLDAAGNIIGLTLSSPDQPSLVMVKE